MIDEMPECFDDRLHYGTPAMVMHWLVVALLIVQFPFGWFMPDVHGGPVAACRPRHPSSWLKRAIWFGRHACEWLDEDCSLRSRRVSLTARFCPCRLASRCLESVWRAINPSW
jgi:hypothetical protein